VRVGAGVAVARPVGVGNGGVAVGDTAGVRGTVGVSVSVASIGSGAAKLPPIPIR
jgi:hypothetical protein